MLSSGEILPQDQLNELRIIGQESKVNPHESLKGFLDRFFRIDRRQFHAGESAVNFPQDFPVERFLATEIVINHSLVDPGGGDDFIDADSVVAFLGKKTDGCAKESLPGSGGFRKTCFSLILYFSMQMK